MSSEEIFHPEHDLQYWLRNCEVEVKKPLKGTQTGTIPAWLQGTFIRNGPGTTKCGSQKLKHLFDAPALLHRFAIKDGQATYQCRFLDSDTLRRNRRAQRIVVSEFGTRSVPDPCHTIFDRLASVFNPYTSLTDNATISVYPFGDEVYAMTEVTNVYKIDPETLDTLDKENLFDALIVCHTAHPHVMPNGDVYNVGLKLVNGFMKHVIVKFPYSTKGNMFKLAEVVGTIEPRWRFNPAYMHSFGITENYFVILEQPLVISLTSVVKNRFLNEPFSDLIKWYPEYETQIILVHRKTGKETRYRTENFFFMHVINSFEIKGKLIVDVCSYKDAKLIDSMYFEAIKIIKRTAGRFVGFRLKVLEWTLHRKLGSISSTKKKDDLNKVAVSQWKQLNIIIFFLDRWTFTAGYKIPDYRNWCQSRPKRIEITLDAPPLSKVDMKLFADVSIEAPRINYDLCNGRPYRYFYGISIEVYSEHIGSIIKIDTHTGKVKTWYEYDGCPSEPIFVAHPDAKSEDDGVLLSALIWGKDDHAVTLLVLNAKDLKEIARIHFITPSQATNTYHGWFWSDQSTGI